MLILFFTCRESIPIHVQDGNVSIGNVSLHEDEARSSEQLREVIKYLRRERELATGRCDVALAEATRATAQLDSANKQLAQVQKELANERENKQVSSYISCSISMP